MLVNPETVNHILDTAVSAAADGPDGFYKILDDIPAAIYVADSEGTLTYFNRACIDFAGRTPEVGRDKWCVTWKLYTSEGEYLPHDQCPMAIAIRDKRPVRDVEAVAERPDGTKARFVPYPTPWFDIEGKLAGAVNLLLDVTCRDKPYHLEEQAARCRRLAKGSSHRQVEETLSLMASKYEEQALKLARSGSAASEV